MHFFLFAHFIFIFFHILSPLNWSMLLAPTFFIRFLICSSLMLLSSALLKICRPAIRPRIFLMTELCRFLTTTNIHRDVTVSLKDIGISESLSRILEDRGFEYATNVQQNSFLPVYSGKDVFIGAETGSGKTFAYILPLIDAHIKKQKENNLDTKYPTHIILAPNKALCRQICSMCADIVSDLNKAGISIKIDSVVSAGGCYQLGSGSGINNAESVPTFLVCTPGHLGQLIRGPTILDEELFANLRHLVLDEADMLLDGSYLRDMEKILDALKVTRRKMIYDGHIQVHEKVVQFVLAGATLPSHGKKSVANYVQSKFPHMEFIRTQGMHTHHPSILQRFIQLPLIAPEHAYTSAAAASGSTSISSSSEAAVEEGVGIEIGSLEHAKAVLRAIIDMPPPLPVVPVVLPLQSQQPSIEKLSNLTKLDENFTISAERANNLPHQVMIFLNTAEAARDLAQSFQYLGIKCIEFHSLCDSNQVNLQLFHENTVKIMICTDSASRGLDFTNVYHVIQADFALNVIQHQHRIGRASRGGKQGVATNMYGESSVLLVNTILNIHANSEQNLDFSIETDDTKQDITPGGVSASRNTIENAFSRRRGFRRNIKKAIRRKNEYNEINTSNNNQ